MLYKVDGDLVEEEKYNIICHQTNCLGPMGAGIAKQIADKYPFVKNKNLEYCKKCNPLGSILPVRVAPSRIVVNLYGQYDYGYKGKFTDYEAFQSALDQFAERLNKSKVPYDWTIAFPWRIGCGHAGGTWNKIFPMIEDFAEKVSHDVYIVRKGD